MACRSCFDRLWADAVQSAQVCFADLSESFEVCVSGGGEGSLCRLGQPGGKVSVLRVVLLDLGARIMPMSGCWR